MKILAVSDVELGLIYNPAIRERFGMVDLVLSCGDLPYYYLEFIISMLDVPLYYVRGNHAHSVEKTVAGDRSGPWGGFDLHRRTCRDDTGLLMAGIEGCLQYNFGPHQYSQTDMWRMVVLMTPALLLNRLRYGRYLDVFVTHASPWKIHDQDDRPHQGIKAFRWFDRVFKPRLHLHGHIHLYRQNTITETMVTGTRIINTFGYRVIDLDLPGLQPHPKNRPAHQPEITNG
jgi:uncharacterized protein